MPYFFLKVLMGEWQTKLQIPELIVKSYNLNPMSVILTKASTKSQWRVNIEKEEENSSELYFKKGWPKFVQENAVEAGDFLLLKFDKKSRFEVIFIGKFGIDKKLERETSQEHVNQNRHKKHHSKSPATTQDYQEHMKGDNHMYVEFKEERENTEDPGTLNQDKRDVTWPFLCHEKEEEEEVDNEDDDNEDDKDYDDDVNNEKEEKREEEEEDEGGGGNNDIGKGSNLGIIPSFTVQLQDVSANKGCMCIPTDFFKRYMRKKKQEVEMETVNGVWKVTSLPFVKRNRIFARFSKGWSEFVRKNEFNKVGQTLVFKMIRRGECPKFMVQKQ